VSVKLALGRGLLASRVVRSVAAVAMAVCCALPASGCGLLGSGKEIATPSVMTVNGAAFSKAPTGYLMPLQFICGPHAPSPPLSWAGQPPGTKSLALILDDSSAPITPYVYWIVFDIGPSTSYILQGQLPPGARQARNSAGSVGYLPPCPGPTGHTYRFTVYALNTVLSLPDGTSLQSAWQAIAAAAIGRGRMTASAIS
jgi:Raf kinase inhibitor-like YbhB/YbcL family protein